MVQYRSFHNDDAPGLTEIWNEAFAGRGAAQLRNSSPLERYLFAKTYFDPAGLIVALEDGRRVGFVHAGFGPNRTETGLSFQTGVICMMGVREAYRGRGIASELLERSIAYLRAKGARMIYAGPMRPLAPFYLGLYGGSDLPGFLASDEAAAPFLEYQGFTVAETALVFQRRLDKPLNVVDARFPALRRRYTMRMLQRSGAGAWWPECVLGPLDPFEIRLEEALSGRVVGRAEIWEMEGFSWRWGVPSAGILSLQIREDLRRQGLGKLLLLHILRYLQEQYYGIVEIQTSQRNAAAVHLFQGLGFEQVDFGRQYRLDR